VDAGVPQPLLSQPPIRQPALHPAVEALHHSPQPLVDSLLPLRALHIDPVLHGEHIGRIHPVLESPPPGYDVAYPMQAAWTRSVADSGWLLLSLNAFLRSRASMIRKPSTPMRLFIWEKWASQEPQLRIRARSTPFIFFQEYSSSWTGSKSGQVLNNSGLLRAPFNALKNASKQTNLMPSRVNGVCNDNVAIQLITLSDNEPPRALANRSFPLPFVVWLTGDFNADG